MKKTYLIFSIIFGIILSIAFNIGIFNNPNFSIADFFLGLSIEFIGWILAASIFQKYYDSKMDFLNRRTSQVPPSSLTGEISQLKKMLDDGTLSTEEFNLAKKKLLQSSTK